MKIHEYNSMMGYLTRPGNKSITGASVLKSSNTEARTPLKRGSSDTKPAPKNSKMENWVNDNIAMYESDTATPEQVAGLEKRVAKARARVAPSEKKKMSKQDEYDTYFNKNSPKYYSKEKSKPIDPVKIDIDIIPELERPDPVFDEQERQFKQILAEQKQKESDKWTTGLASFHRKKY